MSSNDAAQQALAELRAAVAESERAKVKLREQVSVAREEVAQARDRFRKEQTERRQAEAAADRDGENGRARQELQRRIDARQTDWHQVMRGVDTHWSAVEVRKELEQGLTQGLKQLRESDPELAEEIEAIRDGRAEPQLTDRRDDQTPGPAPTDREPKGYS